MRSKGLTVNYIKTEKSNDKKDQLIQDSKEVSNTTHKSKNKNTHSILKKNTKEQSHTCKIRSRNISGYQLQSYLRGVILHLEVSSSLLLPENSKIRYEHNLLRNFIKDYKQGKINPPFSNEIQLSDLPQKEKTTRIVSFDPKVQIKKIDKVCQSKIHLNIYLICLLYNVSLKEASLLK